MSGDVDFLRRTLQVRRQVQRAGAGHVDVRYPKHGSERKVYLADDLVAVLAEHVRRLPPGGDDRWLFVGRDGVAAHANAVF